MLTNSTAAISASDEAAIKAESDNNYCNVGIIEWAVHLDVQDVDSQSPTLNLTSSVST